MKLTKRDKVLLYVLAVVVIVFVMVRLLIYPLFLSYKEAQSELELAKIEVQNMDLAEELAENIPTEKEKVIASFEKDAEGFIPYMTIREITDYANGIVQKYSLTPVSFSVSEPLMQEENNEIFISEITYELNGTYDNHKAFINDLYENKGVLLNYYSLRGGLDPENPDLEISMEISMQIFMYDSRME